MSDINEENAPFYEVQKFRQWWILLLIAIPVILIWWIFSVQIIGGNRFGTNPAPDTVVYILFFLLGIGLPILVYSVKLKTIVKEDRIIIRFVPIYSRTILLVDLKEYYACKYRPLWDYGGYGIRWNAKLGMAYNMSGNHGVKLELTNGKKVLIGSQRAEEMASVIKNYHRQ
jgi:hypothetical protein